MMRKEQTRLSSLAEAVVNTAIGYGIAWFASLYFFRVMGIQMTMHDLWWYTWFMTLISIARGYWVRRMWETQGWKKMFGKTL
jgi:hypothetical protein